MPKLSSIAYYLFHVEELRNMIQWKLWHEPVHERDPSKECETLRECFKYLDMTSRSFSAVIKELHPELLVPVCLFYLSLRGLDTIEDDMTIAVETKEPLLRGFDDFLETDGWTFDGNGPNEKDRELLVHFDVVVAEFKKLKPAYRTIIKDITKRMGDGMADYVNNRDHNLHGVNTIKDYELYCHYVAGLVGEGLTRLFVEAKLANPALLKRPDLHESMGQFLQQTNIIRDIREDHDDKRYFWPREVWSKHVEKFEDLFDPKNKDKALACSSEMTMLALRRADDCLFYLAGIRDQSVFNFCAIPQSMAIATIETCFQNPAIFQKNVKITKGEACGLMLKSTQNLQLVCEVFREYARKIHKRNNPMDPNFLNISVACGQIEVFIESIFPSQTARTLQEKQTSKPGQPALTKEEEEKKKQEAAESRKDVFMVLGVVLALMFVITALMLLVAWLLGARFDLALEQLRNGKIMPSSQGKVQEVLEAVTTAKDEL
ncbi:ERG9, squalene synthase [Myriangium duriaei CBS 260.36]|uniref:Squalene synthase n=1 Tax=Myriangium duriaei CBS 260.36 TaxID=1168546 RepID=A0A9P4MIG7_9PEZI|nr:ERG9, squalene synthase [Myriangium duriaei CBS 260.36]